MTAEAGFASQQQKQVLDKVIPATSEMWAISASKCVGTSLFSFSGNATGPSRDQRRALHWPGIEPGPPAWQARILPLNHQCMGMHSPGSPKITYCDIFEGLGHLHEYKRAHLPVGESNPGLPRDRRGYSPLY